MGNISSVILSIGKYAIFGWSDNSYKGDLVAADINLPTFVSDSPVYAAIKSAFTKHKLERLSDEALIKICRQLEFWYKEEGLQNDPVAMKQRAETLIDQSIWYLPLVTRQVVNENDEESGLDLSSLKVPTRRFGKTNLQIPVITCGGMRLQNTWLPDCIPVLRPSRKTVLNSPPQENIKNCIRSCLALGINHFETARMYGTSEYQIVEALYELIQEGVVKREDFILQTKVPALDEKMFMKVWKQSWSNIEKKLGYIDFFSLHAIAEMDEKTEVCLMISEQFKKEGKIRHIGFSTHATSEQIMKLINTDRFEYVNIHEHFFGSYHGSGTPDTLGGQGNLACVKRALDLDMGVFQISPIDKGGKLFRPSKDCAALIGKELTPIGFALLYGWKKIGFHTASVGLARVSDLDEIMAATKLMALEKAGKIDLDKILDGAIDRLNARKEAIVGREWAEKGLLNIPDCYDKDADGIHIGHILGLHDVLVSFGMYEYCRDRYISLLGTKWNKKKSWEDRVKSMPGANPGRSFDSDVDLTEALKNHYNPSLVLQKLKETHEWLKGDDDIDDDELEKRGWKKGYNLTVWTEMPGELDSRALKMVLLQTSTGGRLGYQSGPGSSFQSEAKQLRLAL